MMQMNTSGDQGLNKRLFDFRVHTDKGGYREYMAYYRQIVTHVFLLLGLPLFIFFAFRFFSHSHYIAGGLMVGMVSAVLILYFIVRNQISAQKRALLFEILIRALVAIFVFYLFFEIHLQGHYYKFPWYFVLPIMIFYSVGIKEGLIWIGSITVMLIFLTPQINVAADNDFVASLNVRFLIVFIFTAGFTCLIAYMARTAMKTLFEKQQHLMTSQDGLRKANRRLEKEIEDRQEMAVLLNKNEEEIRRLSEQTEQFSLAAASMIGLRDQQEIFNRISQAIVRYSDYRRVIISLFKAEPPFREIIGFGGVDETVVDRLRTVELPKSWYDRVFEKGKKIGRFSFYIPHTMKHILNQEATIYGEGTLPENKDAWHPEDNLFVRMSDEKGEFVGVISVDESKSGLQPTDDTVRPLEIFASQIIQIIILKKEQQQRKHLEEELLHARKMESIGTLAGGVAHDFNNILGIILGNLELAEDDLPKGSAVRLNLEEAKTAGLRAKELIRQLLSFSRPTDQARKPMLMTPVVAESLKMMRSTLPANIEIQSELDYHVRPILADATQIHQVIINLLTNAAHAMTEGRGIIRVRLKEKDLDKNEMGKNREISPGEYVMLEVKDTGHGIAPEHLSRVFDPYYTTKSVDKGTGMGLAMVYGIVKSTGGEIIVDSQPKKGTVFTILFPVVDMMPMEKKAETSKIPKGEGRILLIDDEVALTKLGYQMLARLGYEVEAFNDPLKALQWFKEHEDTIDLVITDMTMPNLSGTQVAVKIKQRRPDVPIILCTGFNEQVNESSAEDLSVDAFIMKPMILKELAHTIQKTIR
jgi:signal transduction histidine kinase